MHPDTTLRAWNEQAIALPGAIQYREIPGFPGYVAGSDGSIWSARARSGQWHRLTPFFDNGGYLFVGVMQRCRLRSMKVHTLVLFAFSGPCPQGCEAAHWNGDRADNRPDNLRWATRLENLDDKRRHGMVLAGERHPRSTITEDDVREIRKLVGSGMTNSAVGRMYNLTPQQIIRIVKRVLWKHVV